MAHELWELSFYLLGFNIDFSSANLFNKIKYKE